MFDYKEIQKYYNKKDKSFCFVDKGAFRNVDFTSVITKYALDKLKDIALSNTLSDEKLKSINLFIEKIQNAPLKLVWSESFKNGDGVNNPHGFKQSYVCAGASTPKNTFAPISPIIFNEDVRSLNLDFEDLIPHFKNITKVCEEAKISDPSIIMKRALKLKSALEQGTIFIRKASVEQDLAQCECWVAYMTADGKYASAQWNSVSLSSARLYETKEQAQKAIQKHKYHKAIPVPVSIKIQPLDLSNLPSNIDIDKITPLQEALSIIQRQEIEKALNEFTLERLKERVKILEDLTKDNEDSPIPFERISRKKKM